MERKPEVGELQALAAPRDERGGDERRAQDRHREEQDGPREMDEEGDSPEQPADRREGQEEPALPREDAPSAAQPLAHPDRVAAAERTRETGVGLGRRGI